MKAFKRNKQKGEHCMEKNDGVSLLKILLREKRE